MIQRLPAISATRTRRHPVLSTLSHAARGFLPGDRFERLRVVCEEKNLSRAVGVRVATTTTVNVPAV